MLKEKTILLTAAVCMFSQMVFSQPQVSVSTDLSLQRSFKKEQRFWAVGQNVSFDFHFTDKNSVYASVCYYSPGIFKNSLTASAKSPSTNPQQVSFTNDAELRLKQISFGLKRHLRGTNRSESGWGLYGIAGLGLIFGKAINKYSTSIDTSLYNVPERPVNGTGHFKRLTLDLGLGWEWPLGGDLYFYTESKIWIPATEYPSKYLYVNNNAPLTAMLSAGIRILF